MTPRKTAGYGWRPDSPDHRDLLYGVPAPAKLPSSVDLRRGFPMAPFDQGQLGSCTANAIAGALVFEAARQKLPTVMPSRLFIYYQERALEGTVASDSGAQIRDGMKVVAKLGYPPESDWPYDITRFTDDPPAAVVTEATKDRVTRYLRLPRSLQAMKSCLAQGFPFVLGFTVYESFESPAVARTGHAPLPSASERILGGHAVVACGYDDHSSRFLVRNSWGVTWGMSGYFTLPYEYLLETGLSSDFWTLRQLEESA